MNLHRHLLILIFAIVIVYLNSFWGGFQFDDYNVIVHNNTVHSWHSWFSDLGKGIRPLLKFSYLTNWVSGAGLFGFHFVNVAVHSINAILFYLLARNIALYLYGVQPENQKEIEADRVAFMAAILFALHPVQTEAVTYICGRSVSLMSLFYLSAILTCMKGVESETISTKRLLLYILTPIFFITALLVKETAVTLPLALLLVNRFNPKKKNSALIRGASFKKKILFFFIFTISIFALIAHPKHGRLLEYSFDIRSMKDNVLTQINGVSYLLSRLIVLNGMNIDPDLPVITSWKPIIVVEAFLLSAFFIIGIKYFKSKPCIGFGILWVFLHLIPTNSIVPRLDVANDRQLYLASMGIFLIIAVEAERLVCYLEKQYVVDQVKILYTSLTLILLTLSCFTITRNQAYRSEIALWEDSKAKSPYKPRVHNNLGYAYYLDGRVDDAKKAYLAALKLNPDYKPAATNLLGIN